MKIRPSPFKMLMIILVIGLVFSAASFVISIDWSKGVIKVTDIILPFVLLGISIVFSIFTYLRAYYQLDKNGLTQQFLFKKKYFNFSDIEYIDDIRSRKTKTLVFYLKNGRQVMLAMDNSCKLLFEVSNRCSNLVSRSEFLRNHPNVRL